MSATIFTSSFAKRGLIAQPGRTVNTFPSGLVRVDQTYLGLTSNYSAHRAILAVGNDMPDGDTSPCIDGLKIFPAVQERRREYGFTEYIVSAYGRTNTNGSSYVLGWKRSAMYGWHGTWHGPSSPAYNINHNGLVLNFQFNFGNFNTAQTMTKSEYGNVYPPTIDSFPNVPSLVITQNMGLSQRFDDYGYADVVPIVSRSSSTLVGRFMNENNWGFKYLISVIFANKIPALYSTGGEYDYYSIKPGITYNIGTIDLYVSSETSRTVNYFGDFLDINSTNNFSFSNISSTLTNTIPNR